MLKAQATKITQVVPPPTIIAPAPSKYVRFEKVRFYQPELDSLRFFAFLGVCVFHAMPRTVSFYAHSAIPRIPASAICGAVTSGAYGVDLFFALSAYLITTLLLREREATGKLHVGSFYVRRILRIWPLYFAFIFFATTLQLVVKTEHLGLRYIAGFLVLAANWVYLFYGMPHSITVPLWSVSIEEQFYLTWPLIVQRISRRGMAMFAIGLLVIANIVRLTLIRGPQTAVEANTFARLDPLALGILLALVAGRLPRFRDWQRLVLACAGVTAAVLVGTFCEARPLDNFTVSAVARMAVRPLTALASIALLLAILGMSARWIRNQALLYLGKISYGLYVIHALGLKISYAVVQPVRLSGFLLHLGLGLGITIILASLSYKYLEMPFLRLKESFTHIASRPA